MTDVYIGPIQHHESQTVECWCRHCVWWKERHVQQERKRLREAWTAWAAEYGYIGDRSDRRILALLADPEPES